MLKLRIIKLNDTCYQVQYFKNPISFLGIQIKKGKWCNGIYDWGGTRGIEIDDADTIKGSYDYCERACNKYYLKYNTGTFKVVKTYLESEEKKNNTKQISTIIEKLRGLEDNNPEIDSILEQLKNLN